MFVNKKVKELEEKFALSVSNQEKFNNEVAQAVLNLSEIIKSLQAVSMETKAMLVQFMVNTHKIIKSVNPDASSDILLKNGDKMLRQMDKFLETIEGLKYNDEASGQLFKLMQGTLENYEERLVRVESAVKNFKDNSV
jgi:hypothetical protein